MATLGLTKLQAINKIAAATKQERFTAVDSTGSWPSIAYGTSIAGRIEYFLDLITTQELAKGWEFNTVRFKSYTPSANAITFGSTVLKIIPAGNAEHLRIALRGDAAYDLINDSSSTFTNSTYQFHVITNHEFSTCPPDVKEHITDEATRYCQMMFAGDPQLDQHLAERAVKSDISVSAGRTNYRQTNDMTNVRPMIPQATGQSN